MKGRKSRRRHWSVRVRVVHYFSGSSTCVFRCTAGRPRDQAGQIQSDICLQAIDWEFTYQAVNRLSRKERAR